MEMEDVDIGLQTLLVDSSNLIPNQDELNINRTLPELNHAAARLASKGRPQAQAEAAVYYASRGFDLNRHAKALKQIRFLPSRRSEPLAELDVVKYLDQNRRSNIVDTIRESQSALQRQFRERYENRLQQDWENSKTQILEHLGTISSINTSTQLALPPSKRQYQPPRTLEPIKQRYAEATKQFVEAVKNQSTSFRPATKYQTVQQTLQAFPHLDSADTNSFVDIWRTLGFMVGEKRLGSNGKAKADKSLKENYRIRYLKRDRGLQTNLIHRAKAALEYQYGEYIKNEIESSKVKGGTPGLESDVHNYVYHYFKDGIPPNCEFAQFPNHDRLPVYAVMYYCFRCGCLEGALQAAKMARHGKMLVAAFETLMNNRHARLPNDLWNQLCFHYNKNVKNKSKDVYEVALYCIIAKADPKPEVDNLSDIQSTIEDYLWIRLNMIVEEDEQLPSFLPYGSGDAISDVFSRITLQNLIDLIMKNRMALLQEEATQKFYFSNILLILQQFESCVIHLEANGQLVEAAHVGLVLNWYGLLRSREKVKLGKLISKLVAQVALVDCDLAFYYFYLLRETPQMQDNYDFSDEIVNHLSTSTVDLALIVGTVNRRQVNLNGSLPNHLRQQDVFKICYEAGKQAERNGSYKHAMMLYTLAGSFEQIGQMLVRSLASVLTKPMGAPNKEEFFNLSQRFANHYEYHLATHPAGMKNTQEITKETKSDLFICTKLYEAFELKQKGPKYYENSLLVIDQIQILPATSSDRSKVTAELQHRLELMKNRGSPVRALFSPICNLMIDILKYQAKELKDILRDYNNTDAERRMNSIKERANLLVTYLGRARSDLDIDQTVEQNLSELTNQVNIL